MRSSNNSSTDPSVLVYYEGIVTGKTSKPQKVLLLKLKVLLKDQSTELPEIFRLYLQII